MKKMKLNIQMFSIPYTYLQFEDYPSTDTPLTANNLNQMQNDIHNEIVETDEKITNLSTYSSNEIIIGKWINNKPLYRKVIDIGTLPSSSGSKTVSTGLDFQNTCICRKLYGMVVNQQNGVSLPLPFTAIIPENCISIVIDNSSNILINVGVDRSGVSGYAIIEYTKNID